MKAIIFDFFGVICNEIGSQWYRTRVPAVLVPELKEKYDIPSDTGEVSDEEFFKGLGNAVQLSGEGVHREWIDSAVIDKRLIAFIRELKVRGYKTAICSNTPSKLLRELLSIHGLATYFDVLAVSSEVGLTKPGPDIFNYTLKELRIMPQEAIFVDDRKENIDGARAAGMEAVLYRNSDELREEIEKLLK